MKLLVYTGILTLLFSSVLSEISEEEIEKYKTYNDKCVQESGLDPDGVIKSLDEQSDNKNFKCFLKCLMMQLGTMNEVGEIAHDNVKNLKTDIKKDVVDVIVDACKDVADNDPCEKAFKFTKCLVDESKKVEN